MEHRKTLVLGASPKPDRYAYIAVQRLLEAGHPVVAVGRHAGAIDGLDILQDVPAGSRIHTVTVYLNALNQQEWGERLLLIDPTRIIFNPGAENPELAGKARAQGIDVLEACTLVMIATGHY